ncbi:MAG: hypothetical protein B7X50_07955 [Alishewanella sp. 34-51-39]|nr:MAG: hypothetical protein B7X50_07955 [Alishewanella sp. 34-51-39]
MKDKMLHIPISEITQPIDGAIVMLDRWWTVYKEGYVSIYIGGRKPNSSGEYRFYTPQCDRSEQIATRLGAKKAVFLPIVYFLDKSQGESV